VYIECKKNDTAKEVPVMQTKLDCFIRCMSIIAVKFRGEKYVGKKGAENYVMDLRCWNMA